MVGAESILDPIPSKQKHWIPRLGDTKMGQTGSIPVLTTKIKTMKKIIFLDIDGVLATQESIVDGEWGLVDSKQELLKKLIEATDAEIVLSSSWRLHTLEDTKDYMKEKGFLFCDKLIGVTIRAYHYIDRASKIHLSIPRGVEINQWIDTNIHSDNGKNFTRKKIGKDFTYVILDDDTDMLYEQRHYFINTDSVTGLTQPDIDMAIKILNGPII